ncbi:protein Wnt-4-like isoform X1 [Ixodes scapularis]|nr:protein Wnt-4-like isoform X1 [Ixodes scapularis]
MRVCTTKAAAALLCGVTIGLVLCCRPVGGIRWLSLMRTSVLASEAAPSGDLLRSSWNRSCESLRVLTRQQRRMCKRNAPFMDSVRRGAQLAVLECQHQFRARRWNCSTINGTRIFSKAVSDGTREAAFVHALSAAALAHEVTRACSQGRLEDRCGCDLSVQGDSAEGFKWSGCSDNVAYGVAFSKSFVDARDLRAARSTANPRALVNLHNNNVGRKVVRSQMTRQCKCHGVSGSCELRTCWRELRPFRSVGAVLRDKFDGATEVQVKRRSTPGTRSSSVPRPLIVPVNPLVRQDGTDLQYLRSSPNFCKVNPALGFLGTRGRRCLPEPGSTPESSCQVLCCGRGFVTRTERIAERCDCKFYWCCEVRCATCVREISVSTCR